MAGLGKKLIPRSRECKKLKRIQHMLKTGKALRN